MAFAMRISCAAPAPRATLPSRRQPPQPGRRSVHVAAEAKSLKRSLSAHSRCEIVSPDGVQCYCNVIRSQSNDNGEEGFQFVVVFMKDDDVLESSEYEYYQSEWFATLGECEAAIQSFDIKQHLPELAM